jgi:hypothetical protein
MADAYTPLLRFLEPFVTGDIGPIWPNDINNDMVLFEQAITGNPGIAITGNYSLSVSNGGTDDQRSFVYTFTGALSGNATITIPGTIKSGMAVNNTTGSKSVTLSTGSGRTATLPFISSYGLLFAPWTCDGTNVDIMSLFQTSFLVANSRLYGSVDNTGTPQITIGLDSLNTTTLFTTTSTSASSVVFSYQPAGNVAMLLRGDGVVAFSENTTADPITSTVNGHALTNSTGKYCTYNTGSATPFNCGTGIDVGTGNLIAFYKGGIGTFVGGISYNGGLTHYYTSSDYRLKTTFGPYDPGAVFDQVKVYEGRYKKEIRHPHSQPFVLAHEIAELFPFAVRGEKDAVDEEGRVVPQQVDFLALVPAMIAEVKRLRAELKGLAHA